MNNIKIVATNANRTTSTDQSVLVAALLDPAVYGPSVDRVEKLETHISYLFLAGPKVYKVKKAVNLGFLDFSTLAQRHLYCLEELRLNRRLAPALYLDVVPITGSYQHPRLGGPGAPIEFAVKMHRFAQDNLLDSLCARNRLTRAHIDQLADKIAAFHGSAAAAGGTDTYGIPDAIRQPALENFVQIRGARSATLMPESLDLLEQWTVHQCDTLDAVFRTRKAGAFVRECHGDLHLGNIAMVQNEVTIFDCLEFNANLRWIDVMSEAAFLTMDLHSRSQPQLAQRFLNRYLEITGDYAGLTVLRFYMVYRAMVRAKVHALRAEQTEMGAPQRAAAHAEYRNYLDLARQQTHAPRPAIVITHGLSGSGKTTHTENLLAATAAIRVRSDIERKRLQGLPALARSNSEIEAGLYGPDTSNRTYARLASVATATIEAGYTAIVDATFLHRQQREKFRRLALELNVAFLILDFTAPEAALRSRVAARQQLGGNASEADVAVLEHQLQTQQPLQTDEASYVVRIDAMQAPSDVCWESVLDRLNVASQ